MLIIRKVMVRHAPMAAKLCIQNGIELVGVRISRNNGSGSSIINSELAELEGGNEESGGELEV